MIAAPSLPIRVDSSLKGGSNEQGRIRVDQAGWHRTMSVELLAEVFRIPPAREPDNDRGVSMIHYNASRPNYHPPRFEPKVDRPLLAEIELFLAKHHAMKEGKFGCLSCGNYYIVRAIRGGAKLMPKTEKSIRDFMRRYIAP